MKNCICKFAVTISLSVIALATPAVAQTWTGNGTDDNWGTAANWSSALGTGLLFFDGTQRLTPVQNLAARNQGALIFNAGAGAFTLTGNGVTSTSGGVRNDSINTQTIDLPLTVGSATTGNLNANTGNVRISGTLAGTSGYTVFGSNQLILSGNNTNTGTISLSGGNLVLDYATNDPYTGNAITMTRGGSVTFRGNVAGSTADTVGAITTTTRFSNRFRVENDADITFGSTWTGSNLSSVIFETPGAGKFLTSSALPVFSGNVTGSSFSSTLTVVNGVLMQGANTGARANLYVVDDTGVGFATQNGANEIVRYTGATALPAGSAATSGIVNYSMNSTVTRSANLNFSTISIDTGSTTGPSVDLNLTTNDLNPAEVSAGGTGRGILFTGVNNSTISGRNALGSLTVANFSTGLATLGFSMNGQALVSSGPGILNYSGTAQPGDVYVYEGTLRFSGAMNYTNNNLLISTGGVFEIGADLSNTTDGDFVRALGTGAGQVQLLAGAGFSAHGADRIVALGGVATPTAITWGASNFLAGTNERLIFGSSASNATLEFQNSINLNDAQRIIEVRKGVGANLVEARMTGVLSGGVAGTTPSGITKTGLGTLELTGANTYGGPTYVAAGTLLVNNATGSGLGTGNVTVVGGRLGGTGSFTGNVVVASGGTLAPGASIATLESGALSFTAGSTFAYEVDSDVALAVGADLQKVTGNLSLDGVVTLTLANLDTTPVAFALGTTFSLINYTGTWNGGLFTVNGNAISNNGTFSALGNTWQLTYNAAEGGLNFSGEYFGGSDSFVNIVAVPEPSTWALLALGLTAVAVLRRRRA